MTDNGARKQLAFLDRHILISYCFLPQLRHFLLNLREGAEGGVLFLGVYSLVQVILTHY